MTKKLGRGDSQRGLARVLLAGLTIGLVVFVLTGGIPSIAATGAASASSSPTAESTQSNTPSTPPAQQSPSTPRVQLLNPSQYEDPVIVSNKQDTDAQYHFVAVVANAPSGARVQITIQELTGSPASPSGNNITLCDPAIARSADTYDCFATPPNDGDYRVTARLSDSTGTLDTDTQDVTVDHTAESLEITAPSDAGELGFFTPNGGNPGFLMSVKYSADSSGVNAFYTTSPIGTEPAWRRCTTQVATYYSDNTANIGCEVASGVTAADVTGVAAVAQMQPPPHTFPADQDCTPSANPPSITCPQPPVDQSGDAHRVVPYLQGPGTISLSPQNQSVPRNSDDSQCATVAATVLDQKQKPVWRANVDVHAAGPQDAAQFAVAPGTSEFQKADQDHDGAESAYDCASAANDTSHDQAIHSVVAAPDIKHIESTTGSDTSGRFVFGLHAAQDGTTSITSWWDVIDNDLTDNGEPAGTGSVAWGNAGSSSSASNSASSSGSSSSSATATATTSSSPTPSSSGSSSSSSSPSPSSSPSSSSTQPTTPPPPVAERTKVTISYDPNAHFPSRLQQDRKGAFEGKVKAATGRCRNRRKIRLVRVHHGVVKKTKSRRGEWKIFFPNAHGTFFAKATRKVYVDKFGRTVTCAPDKSPKIKV